VQDKAMGTAKRRTHLRVLVRLLLLGALGYSGAAIVLNLLQTTLIFPAGGYIWRTPSDPPFRWAFENLRLQVGDETTHAWWIPLENAKGVFLFSHGNGGTIADRLEQCAMIRELGYSILLYDYGGFGESSGRPSEQRCYEDGKAAWAYLTEQKQVPADQIVLYGESLGGGVVCELARTVRPKAVVLQCSFLSVTRRAKEIFPFMPIGLLLRHRFDNEAKIKELTAPILIIASPHDSIIPFHHGKKLLELAPEPKSFLELRGDHNECVFVSENEYKKGLADFLERIQH
jgi:hypothetical protein